MSGFKLPVLPFRGKLPHIAKDDGEKNERIERIKAAQTRRDAGAARAKVRDGEPQVVQKEDAEVKSLKSKATIFSKLKAIPTIGAPLRLIEAHLEKKKEQQRLEHEKEAIRVWDLLQHLEPGTRVKLKGLKSKYGGVDYNNKLATVQAGVGNRFSVKLDLIEKDGAVREGQGAEIKIGLHNMTIWDADVEAVLAAEEAAAKLQARKERDEAIRDLLSLRFKKLLFQHPKVEPADTAVESLAEQNAPLPTQHIDFSTLTAGTNVEELQAFHRQEKMIVPIRSRDSGPEIFEKIQTEWHERSEASKKAERSLMDAEAAIRVGSTHPATRNNLRVFVLNSAFEVAIHAMDDARRRLMKYFAQTLTEGTLQSAQVDKVVLDKKAPDKGGPSAANDAYVTNVIQITHGMGQGQYAIICSYDGPSRTACVSAWNIAIPDTSSSYEILGSCLDSFHYQGKAQGGDLQSLKLSTGADPLKNFYTGMMVRIIAGPGRSQVANIVRYDSDSKIITIDRWVYDKTLLEQALDQDDKDIPIVEPSAQSHYEIQQQDPETGKARPLHLKGRLADSTLQTICLAKYASEKDLYTGKGIMITKGTGRGQKTRILNYLGAKRSANIAPWQPGIPDKTSRYKIFSMPQDKHFFDLYDRLQRERATAVEMVTMQEALRRRKIRTRFRAAAKSAIMVERAGQEILVKRQQENAASWVQYQQDSFAKGDANILIVDGVPTELTWYGIISDSVPVSSPAQEGESPTGGPDQKVGLDVIQWKGHLLQAPLYSDLPKDKDGAVEQPVRLCDPESGKVVYVGPTHDWKLWKSLMEDGSTVADRDDVFLWRGRTLLQPVTTIGEDGEDVYIVVEDDTGMLIYCGPDVEPQEESPTAPQEQRAATVRPAPPPENSADASLLMAMNESMNRRFSEELVESAEEKVRKTRVRISEVGDLENFAAGRSDENSGLAQHAVGGELWESFDDVRLWKALLDESLPIEGRADAFTWRDMVILQPKREGDYQRVVSETGQLIFYGVNPNESVDFPTEDGLEDAETKDQHQKPMKSGTIATDHGSYTGDLSDGRRHGEGVFTWRNGQVYSGGWQHDMPHRLGTEIFPSYDSKRRDKEGETTFPYYEGHFKKGRRYGKGVYVFASGDKYQGEFRDGLFDGHGVLVTAKGSFLDCRWRAGMPQSSRVEHVTSARSARRPRASDASEGDAPAEGDKDKDYAFENRAANMDDRYLDRKLTGDGTQFSK